MFTVPEPCPPKKTHLKKTTYVHTFQMRLRVELSRAKALPRRRFGPPSTAMLISIHYESVFQLSENHSCLLVLGYELCMKMQCLALPRPHAREVFLCIEEPAAS